nr:immunoglobulin heavy chain junction region [Mus musculus]
VQEQGHTDCRQTLQ